MPPTPRTLWSIAAVAAGATTIGAITWFSLTPSGGKTDGELATTTSQPLAANTANQAMPAPSASPGSSLPPTSSPTATQTTRPATPDPKASSTTAPNQPQAQPKAGSGQDTLVPQTSRPAVRPSITIKPQTPQEPASNSSLNISGINVSMPVIPVGVDPDTGMTIPKNPRIAGWYKFGPAPGAASGAAVISAHVDSRELGVGPLASLKNTKPGATVTVTHEGKDHSYRVVRTERYRKTALDTAKLFDRAGPHRLHVVTCGGKFNRKTGHYDDNVVVFAEPIR